MKELRGALKRLMIEDLECPTTWSGTTAEEETQWLAPHIDRALRAAYEAGYMEPGDGSAMMFNADHGVGAGVAALLEET